MPVQRLYQRVLNDVTTLGGPSVYVLFTVYLLAAQPTTGASLILAGVVTHVLGYGIRATYHRDRPQATDKPASIVERIQRSSLPSMHAARINTLLFTTWPTTSNDVSLIFLIIALTVMITRHALDEHYVFDLIAGALLALGSSWLAVTIVT